VKRWFPSLRTTVEPGPDYKVVVVQVLENNHSKINDDTATWDNLGQQLNKFSASWLGPLT
jgi:hypothetical protein